MIKDVIERSGWEISCLHSISCLKVRILRCPRKAQGYPIDPTTQQAVNGAPY